MFFSITWVPLTNDWSGSVTIIQVYIKGNYSMYDCTLACTSESKGNAKYSTHIENKTQVSWYNLNRQSSGNATHECQCHMHYKSLNCSLSPSSLFQNQAHFLLISSAFKVQKRIWSENLCYRSSQHFVKQWAPPGLGQLQKMLVLSDCK